MDIPAREGEHRVTLGVQHLVGQLQHVLHEFIIGLEMHSIYAFTT